MHGKCELGVNKLQLICITVIRLILFIQPIWRCAEFTAVFREAKLQSHVTVRGYSP